MPYNLAPRLFARDLPAPSTKDVEAILEVDRLFWIDPRHAARKQFERALVPGEELPYVLPVGKDAKGIALTVVLVARWGRTFLSSGKPVLLIVDNPPPKEPHKKIKKVKQKNVAEGVKDALADFRRFLGGRAREVHQAREARLARKPTSEQRDAQREQDKQRLQERRRARAAARATLIATKRAEREQRKLGSNPGSRSTQ